MGASKAALHGLCLLGLFLCILSSSAIAASEPDFLYLTLMWPGGHCKSMKPGQRCCVPLTGEPAADFLVQSMETYDSATGNSITHCKRSCRFLINPLSDLTDDLSAYWPSLHCPSNNGLEHWRHAWCTYGSCSNLVEVAYFNRTLRLRKEADLLAALASKGIIPSETANYSLGDIQDAVVAKIGSSAVVECTRRCTAWPFGYDDYLSRISICISRNDTAIIDCPITQERSCGDTVKFPPIPYTHGDDAPAPSPSQSPMVL